MAKNLLLEKRDNVGRCEDELASAREGGKVALIALAETQLTNAQTDLALFELRLRELEQQLDCLRDL